ncbi:MAG: hypothetical protein GWN73_39030, partial [Actinobacteria bacterium]|nr:hypothetical protein [Actinomycetota bacterium]NIS36533.1 hypothetical protein [Actinomycetota bacterium]NIU71044.1 hypothetical protein [Actinomycetota bacterium]NIV55712.1 hypothetical protein [Actinomycetota bacterium]NIV87106.1 hypothetical protein [Actinomycetota bacterium]
TLGARGELLSYHRGRISYTRSFASLDDRLTRGGPLARDVAGHDLSFDVDTDSRRPVTVRLEGTASWDDAGGWERSVELNVGLRPANNWSIRFGPE